LSREIGLTNFQHKASDATSPPGGNPLTLSSLNCPSTILSFSTAREIQSRFGRRTRNVAATWVPYDDSTSVPYDDSTSVPYDDSTSVPYDDSTSVPYDESTSVPYDDSTSVPYDDSTSVPYDDSTSVPHDNSACLFLMDEAGESFLSKCADDA
ncbi:Small proline-rich protein 3-like 2, partial [Homarus americanus]